MPMSTAMSMKMGTTLMVCNDNRDCSKRMAQPHWIDCALLALKLLALLDKDPFVSKQKPCTPYNNTCFIYYPRHKPYTSCTIYLIICYPPHILYIPHKAHTPSYPHSSFTGSGVHGALLLTQNHTKNISIRGTERKRIETVRIHHQGHRLQQPERINQRRWLQDCP
jgi:hypothetical protein